jgi:hypothetical protein
MPSLGCRRIQSRLAKLGFYKGAIDGKWRMSRAAEVLQGKERLGNPELGKETRSVYSVTQASSGSWRSWRTNPPEADRWYRRFMVLFRLSLWHTFVGARVSTTQSRRISMALNEG